MKYKLVVIDNVDNFSIWRNFIRHLQLTTGNMYINNDELDCALAAVNATNPGVDKPYIEFENEEDATIFKLRYS